MPIFNPRDLLVQEALIARGHNLGPEGADGYFGVQSETAYQLYLEKSYPDISTGNDWPEDNEEALNAFYGKPDFQRKVAPNVYKLTDLPYELHLSWAPAVKVNSISCNKKIAKSLRRVLQGILDHYGLEGIKEHKLDAYGGCINVRKARGKNWASRHSWGIAIDLNPLENGLNTPWEDGKQGQKGYATMPIKAIEIFESEGWRSGARAWKSDAMHFDAVSYK